MNKMEMILAIVNIGYAEDVMDAATKVGATGGTIINARGTANPEAEKFFGLSINSEKEIVLIIVNSKIKDSVLKAIYEQVGLQNDGQGIAFSLPVDDVVGMNIM